MIRTPTAFVLGAGASMEFGFPSGFGLYQLIAAPDLSGGNSTIMQRLLGLGYSSDLVRKFGEALRLSGHNSVDAFLEHRPDFLDIGKTAIAAALVPHEIRFNLWAQRGGPSLYSYLWKKLNTEPKRFHQNQVSFITFNYDRSLEEYLFTSLMNAYGLDQRDAAGLASTVAINHVHGVLGEHPAFSEQDSRRYENEIDQHSVQQAARGIRVIHEKGMSHFETFHLAQLKLRNVERVVFLGFGYDPTSLKRLMISDIPQGSAVYGSAFGVPDQERQLIKDRLGREIILGSRTENALNFLEEHVDLR